MSAVLFWMVCGLTVLAGLAAATVANLFRAALCLGACLVGLAGLYLFLDAEYLAAIQLVVYVGGILVLTVFGVMFSGDINGHRGIGRGRRVAAGLIAVVTLAAMGRLAWLSAGAGALPPTAPQVPVGALLMGSYAVPAIIVVGLLLVAVIGAMGAVRREDAA
jgi:NADH:ubiquinone oxidoreductase subunit 6 (subunit J)